MPLAVAHILFPLILSDLFRDLTKKGKKLLNRQMILVAGISGLLPDIDLLLFFILSRMGDIDISSVHRTFTHSLLLPATGIVIAALLFYGFKTKKAHMFAIMFAFGTFTHILLDGLINGTVMPFYPFSTFQIGLDLAMILVPASITGDPTMYKIALMSGVDAILLSSWLVFEEWKKKIRDYI